MSYSPFFTALESIGGISTLDSAATRRALDELDRMAEERIQAETSMVGEFLFSASQADAYAVCEWAPVVNKRVGEEWKLVRPSFSDVMLESLDYSKGPEMAEAMQIVLDSAKGGNEKAKDLLRRMAKTFAEHNSEE